MKLNEHQALSSSKIVLVPYSAHHVPTYHTWMQDPGLQAATASEPLTLDEEYAMQRSWREDRDKLTFIICLPLEDSSTGPNVPVRIGTDDSPEKMIGDINMFLFEPDDDEDDSSNEARGAIIGEIELMIARKDLHRRGFGRAALQTFMHYIIRRWPAIYSEYMSEPPDQSLDAGIPKAALRYMRVKIQQSNLGSIALFESAGFKRTSEGPNYFGEVELRRQIDEVLQDSVLTKGGDLGAGMVPYEYSDSISANDPYCGS